MDIQALISKKAANESNIKADKAHIDFIHAMKSEHCSEYVNLKPLSVNDDGTVRFNLNDLIRYIVEVQKPKLEKNEIKRQSKEFFDKVNSMHSELTNMVGDYLEGNKE